MKRSGMDWNLKKNMNKTDNIGARSTIGPFSAYSSLILNCQKAFHFVPVNILIYIIQIRPLSKWPNKYNNPIYIFELD